MVYIMVYVHLAISDDDLGLRRSWDTFFNRLNSKNKVIIVLHIRSVQLGIYNVSIA